jgi:hypothetical protein
MSKLFYKQLASYIKEHRLSDILDIFESHNVTGDFAIICLSSIQAAGEVET